MQFKDFIARMTYARAMSTFGPDFTDPIVQKAWYAKLKVMPIQALDKALSNLTGDREFPSINDILGFHKPEEVTQAIDGFELLWSKIGSVGYYGHPELPNAIGLAVEKLGGWKFICNNWREDRRAFHERDFKQALEFVTDQLAKGITRSSKYALPASKTEPVASLPPKAQEALRIALSDSKRRAPNLTDRFKKSIKNK